MAGARPLAELNPFSSRKNSMHRRDFALGGTSLLGVLWSQTSGQTQVNSQDPDTNVKITPTATFQDVSGPVDLIFVPGGGKGTVALMTDHAALAFLAAKGKEAKWVTSVSATLAKEKWEKA
jgi:hypothetical protein